MNIFSLLPVIVSRRETKQNCLVGVTKRRPRYFKIMHIQRQIKMNLILFNSNPCFLSLNPCLVYSFLQHKEFFFLAKPTDKVGK